MDKPRLVVVGPIPPPFHGVTVSTSLVLANEKLQERFDVAHFDTSDHRSRETVGKWELINVFLALKHAAQLFHALSRRKGVVYLPISGGLPGFVRDSLLIHIARLRGWKVAGHFRNGDFHLFLAGQRGPIRRYIRWTTGRLTSAGVLGESIRSEYAAFLEPTQMAIVPNGTPDVEGGAPERNGSPQPQVLYLSNLRRRKGVVEAMTAAVACLDEGHRARFVFAGDLEDPSVGTELKRLAAKHPGAIAIRGAVSGTEKAELYRSSDVFLFPPVKPEGHPRVVLEAMAAGLPVVTTARGAIPETVQDGEAGYVLPDAEPHLIAERLTELITDDGTRNRMGRAARARYVSHYTTDRADERLADWLQSL